MPNCSVETLDFNDFLKRNSIINFYGSKPLRLLTSAFDKLSQNMGVNISKLPDNHESLGINATSDLNSSEVSNVAINSNESLIVTDEERQAMSDFMNRMFLSENTEQGANTLETSTLNDALQQNEIDTNKKENLMDSSQDFKNVQKNNNAENKQNENLEIAEPEKEEMPIITEELVDEKLEEEMTDNENKSVQIEILKEIILNLKMLLEKQRQIQIVENSKKTN